MITWPHVGPCAFNFGRLKLVTLKDWKRHLLTLPCQKLMSNFTLWITLCYDQGIEVWYLISMTFKWAACFPVMEWSGMIYFIACQACSVQIKWKIIGQTSIAINCFLQLNLQDKLVTTDTLICQVHDLVGNQIGAHAQKHTGSLEL